MARKGEIVGAVDFGSRDFRVLIARRTSDGAIQVIGHGAAPARGCMSQGVIQDLGAAQSALKQALMAAEKEAGTRVTSLFCGINGKNVQSFIREGNVKLEKELVEIGHLEEARDIASRDVLAAGKHVISSITSQEWYVDNLRVSEPIGMHGGVLKARVHFAQIPSLIEDNVVTCIESQGRELEDIVFLPLAAGLGCLTPEDIDLGVALLDMGSSTTSLAIYRDRRILNTTCFDWGSSHITRDVAAGLRISFEEAVELVLMYGLAENLIREETKKDGAGGDAESESERRGASIKLKTFVRGAPEIVNRDELDEIIFERSKELMTKIRQHVHANGFARHLVRGVVITGGAAQIKNQTALAEAVFQVPARIGLPTGIDVLPPPVNTPEFVPVVGVARHGFEYRAAARSGRIQVNRGPLRSVFQRAAGFLRKYFF